MPHKRRSDAGLLWDMLESARSVLTMTQGNWYRNRLRGSHSGG